MLIAGSEELQMRPFICLLDPISVFITQKKLNEATICTNSLTYSHHIVKLYVC